MSSANVRQKTTAAASRGSPATARLSCKLVWLTGPLRARAHTHTPWHTNENNEMKLEQDWFLAALNEKTPFSVIPAENERAVADRPHLQRPDQPKNTKDGTEVPDRSTDRCTFRGLRPNPAKPMAKQAQKGQIFSFRKIFHNRCKHTQQWNNKQFKRSNS